MRLWSKNNIGEINDQVKEWEAKTELLGDLDIMNNTEQGRSDLNKGYAEYVRWLNMQDSMLRQKTQLQWFKDGDKNTKYFHSVLRTKRRRLQIPRIKNDRGRWVQGDNKVAKVSIKHFQIQFNLNHPDINHDIINYIP